MTLSSFLGKYLCSVLGKGKKMFKQVNPHFNSYNGKRQKRQVSEIIAGDKTMEDILLKGYT